MAEYKLELTTGSMEDAGTWDHVSVILFGSEGQSERTELDNFGKDFNSGSTETYTVKTGSSLGKLLLLKLEKDVFNPIHDNEWYCSTVVVTTPEGDVILFPCYRWISRKEEVELRGGRAIKVFEEEHPLLIAHREKELANKKSFYQWTSIGEGLPNLSSDSSLTELPAEIRFTKSKREEVKDTKQSIGLEFLLKGMLTSTDEWESFEDMKRVCVEKTAMSEYVTEHWQEDDFFGSQFLSGNNPNVIKRCSELPPNFPVTDEMVKPFLEKGSSLQREMEKGNIFLSDQKMMDGIAPSDKDGELLFATAGLCLFYSNPENKLMPIAIQLHQEPSEQNPIFLPSDTETDWLLAKIFIKNADVMDHESVHHLMNTHFLTEVFAVATLRNFPVIHPIYKLLIPHFWQTLYINSMSHDILLGPKGMFNMSSLGSVGLKEVMRRNHSATTYGSLCLPENITARGLESVPNFYYRDDGLKLWDIINRFVKDVVEYYYPTDCEVHKDTELQEWICEIFTYGFLGNHCSGIPSCFHTTEEVTRFVTMVIFRATAQHAAVNNGQFDHFSWVPNGPLLLHKPPPTTKGQSSMKAILETLPNIGESANVVSLVWILSQKYIDFVPLGAFPEKRFDEPLPKQKIKDLQAALSSLSEEITQRNAQLEAPYTYLNPPEIENSIAI